MLWTALHGRCGSNPADHQTNPDNPSATVSVGVFQGSGKPPLWVRVRAFGKLRKTLLLATRGQSLSIIGRLDVGVYEGRPSLSVVASDIGLGSRPPADADRAGQDGGADRAGQYVGDEGGQYVVDDGGDDLPF